MQRTFRRSSFAVGSLPVLWIRALLVVLLAVYVSWQVSDASPAVVLGVLVVVTVLVLLPTALQTAMADQFRFEFGCRPDDDQVALLQAVTGRLSQVANEIADLTVLGYTSPELQDKVLTFRRLVSYCKWFGLPVSDRPEDYMEPRKRWRFQSQPT